LRRDQGVIDIYAAKYYATSQQIGHPFPTFHLHITNDWHFV